jgi:hypothetical protein
MLDKTATRKLCDWQRFKLIGDSKLRILLFICENAVAYAYYRPR